MKKIFKKTREIIQKIIHFLVKSILILCYAVFISPFGVIVKVFRDDLNLKSGPFWEREEELLDISEFLRGQ